MTLSLMRNTSIPCRIQTAQRTRSKLQKLLLAARSKSQGSTFLSAKQKRAEVDSCSLFILSASPWTVLQAGSFVSEQPMLALKASRITGQRSVGPYDAMAGDHNGNRIERVGHADGAQRFR